MDQRWGSEPTPTMQKLEWPPDLDRYWRDSAAEKLLLFVPILGWTIAWHLWRKRTEPLFAHLHGQLLSRAQPDRAIWGDDPQRAEMAAILCAVAKEEMGWPNDRFIPEDPFEIVFCPLEDALDRVCAVLNLEERLEIEIPDATVETWNAKTLGGVVDDLLALQSEG